MGGGTYSETEAVGTDDCSECEWDGRVKVAKEFAEETVGTSEDSTVW